MNTRNTGKNKSASEIIAAALLLLVAATSQPTLAQDYTGDSGYPAIPLGSDESLLPPEVVPLDPSTASSMSAAQAEQRQSAMSSPNYGSMATEGSMVPGLANSGMSGGAPGGMQSAKDARNAAFQALYGQGSLPQAQTQQNAGVSQNYMMGQPPMNGSGSAPYGTVAHQSMPAQSQTLSGTPKIQPKIRDIRRAGISNTISALAGFTGGAVAASALMRPYNPYMGLGMFGLTMTGFGVRNAFRF